MPTSGRGCQRYQPERAYQGLRCGKCPSPRALANTSSSGVCTSQAGPGVRYGTPPWEVPPTGGHPEAESRTEGHVTPALGTNQRLQKGATLSAPHPAWHPLRETLSLSLCQFSGGPGASPGSPLQRVVSGLALSRRRGPSLVARALDSIWARQEAGEGSGASKVRWLTVEWGGAASPRWDHHPSLGGP